MFPGYDFMEKVYKKWKYLFDKPTFIEKKDKKEKDKINKQYNDEC